MASRPTKGKAAARRPATTVAGVKPVTHLRDLTPDPANARKHTPRNVGTIVSALHEVGAARSIVIDEDGVVLAGNATIEAAAEAGIERVRVVEADGQTIIAVRRSGLTPVQKARLALYDNRAAELADGWDAEVLRELQAQDVQLDDLWTPEELADVLAAVIEPVGGQADPDAVPEARATDIKAGDLFEVGRHRLLCGDSTKAEDVARVMGADKAVLMNTDPPYGVALDLTQTHEASNAAKGITTKYRQFGRIKNDEMSGEQLQAFLESVIRVAVPHLDAHAAFYLWHPMLTQGTFFAAAAAADILIHRQIIWVKPHFIFGRGDYHWRHELCFYGWQRGHRPKFYGERNQDTVWTLDEGGGAIRKDQGHPTQKPVELFIRPMRNHCRVGEVAYEPFCGSGSQLIAGEQCDVSVRAIEIEPSYCQVSLDRWQQFTGQQPVKVGAGVRRAKKASRA